MADQRKQQRPHDPAETAGTVPAPSAPAVLVIFGATGDLTRRKLVPALHNLECQGLLPPTLRVIGVARRPLDDDAFRAGLVDAIREHAASTVDCGRMDLFAAKFRYLVGNVDDPATHARLAALLAEPDLAAATAGNALYYLATAPEHFGPIVTQLGQAGLTREERGWRRVVVEKPFGHDLASARALNAQLAAHLAEHQLFRIDHYLGKETVQNILVLRFGNGIFEPIWNRRYIDHVQITAAEALGVGSRGGYYDGSGALRDMVPNHLFQLITLTAMEPPVSFKADAVRDEQTKILTALQPLAPEEVLKHAVRGQYGPGSVAGQVVPGYRQEPQIDPRSGTETFVALKLFVDNWRWAGVPFYLRTGKRLPRAVTEVTIQFKAAPFVLFRDTPVERLPQNRLVLRLQPDEGIKLRFGAKLPGPQVRLGWVDMDFAYADYFGKIPGTGYERLLHDALSGDATLFQRADQVEAGWQVIAPVQDVWRALPARDFPNYAAGTWGPKEAEELMARDGRRWRTHREP